MKSNTILRALLAALILAFASLVAWSMRDSSAREGGRAPQFSIVTDQGKHITPASFGGRILVLNFWATWCAPCLEELPSLNQFQQQFAGSGVVVVGVSIDKSQQKYADFLKRIPVSFQTFHDPEANISGAYGTFQYPETYIIKDGIVMRKYAEGENWLAPDIQQYVRGLL
ncbi:MAG TPA: TlpA disulfide reductase family protein [Bryobacteraceae bacterium]|nr:TlpA disulfide reductase family protein [Bryobacteraceae bacterium]